MRLQIVTLLKDIKTYLQVLENYLQYSTSMTYTSHLFTIYISSKII